jgi:hypothetical protein
LADDKREEVHLSTVGSQHLTTVFHSRTLDMHIVTESELTDIASGAQSIHIGFFGITFGALFAVAIVLITLPLQTSAHAAFVASLVVLLIMSAYFGVRAVSDYRQSKHRVELIRSKPSRPPL